MGKFSNWKVFVSKMFVLRHFRSNEWTTNIVFFFKHVADIQASQPHSYSIARWEIQLMLTLALRSSKCFAVFKATTYVYNEVSEAAVGEVLFCKREPSNALDHYAVSVEISQKQSPSSPNFPEVLLDLANKIFSKKNQSSTLLWRQRLNIAIVFSCSRLFYAL